MPELRIKAFCYIRTDVRVDAFINYRKASLLKRLLYNIIYVLENIFKNPAKLLFNH